MSRSGYQDWDGESGNWDMICWRGAVASSIRGKKGQRLLVDMVAALDAMPEKRLIAHDLKTTDGAVCALGAVGLARGVEMSGIDPEYPEQVAAAFDIAPALAKEIVYENDEYEWDETPESRWARMRRWAVSKIRNGTEPDQER